MSLASGSGQRERERESKKPAQNGNVLILALLIIGGLIGSSFAGYKILHPSLPAPSSKTEIKNTPTITPTPSTKNQPLSQNEKTKNNSEEPPASNGQAIKCLGADRKFSYVTQEVCDATRKYWTAKLGSFPSDPDEVIRCLGADGKYSNVPRKTCEDTNNFWATHTPSSSSNSSSSTSSSCTLSSDTTAPTVPGTPAITAVNTAMPTWTWTASTDSGCGLASAAYTIQWSQDSSFASGVSSTTTTTNSYTHSSALANGIWYFRVKATDSSGNSSSYSTNGSAWVLPQNLLATQQTTLENFNNVSSWSGADGSPTLASDTTYYKTGGSAMSYYCPATKSCAADKTGISLDLSNDQYFRMYLYIPDTTYLSSIGIYLGNDSGLTNYYAKSIAVSNLRSGWNAITYLRSDFTSTGGTPSWSSPFVRIRLRVAATASGATTVTFALFAGAPSAQAAAMIMLDDGNSSLYTVAYPYMNNYHYRGTGYVACGVQIDTSGKVTTSQLQEMYNTGWDIGNHTTDHVDLTTLTEAQQETELTGCRDTLNSKGLTRASRHVAYPAGTFNADTITAMTATSMLTGRNTRNSIYPVLPPNDNYYFQLGLSFSTSLTLASAKGSIDAAITRGEIIPINGHDLVTTPSLSTDWAISDFQALIDYLNTKGIPVLTINDFYNLQSGPITIPK